jgi:hypothetical protein
VRLNGQKVFPAKGGPFARQAKTLTINKTLLPKMFPE